MTAERWQIIDRIVQAALARRPEERARFLDETCADDDSLRREVESLIRHQLQASDFLESPALADHAELMLSPQPDLRRGQVISHYKTVSKIGQGGMGQVYLAEDSKLGRKVALKLLDSQMTADTNTRTRFLREARVAAQLDHPNICAIYEIGEVKGQPFIAMQYVEGETLRRVMGGGRLTLDRLLSISLQVLDALAAAHRQGIIHRDIKPGNIIITPRGQVKVLDFGLAKDERTAKRDQTLTVTGAVMGTPSYMSPEQARGERADQRSDIFSLGVVMYEMATARSPFKRGSQAESMNAVINEPHTPVSEVSPGAPAELVRVIDRAMMKEAGGRYQTAEEMIEEMRKVVEQAGGFSKLFSSSAPDGVIVPFIPLRPGSLLARAQHLLRQAMYRAAAAIAVALLLVLAAVVLFSSGSSNRANALTERDTILIADFANATGDEVFDGTLKQAIAVHLGQSPFLNIFSEDRIREALRFMNRSPTERLTRDVAREVCQRQGIKAMLAGSIASLGAHYVITLEAVNADNGDVIAREQVEAESKERVLGRLGESASRLREKLGESLAMIERFDVPIEQATTSSLEALKAYSMGREQHSRGRYLEAIPLFKRAVELDPEFALAYSYLSAVYSNTGAFDLRSEFGRKALEKSERASERERLIITARYYVGVVGQLDKAIEVLEMWKRAYPRDPIPPAQLASCYFNTGQPERAVAEAREAIRLDPNNAATHISLGIYLMRLNRFEEAREVFEQSIAQGLDASRSHLHLFEIAIVQGDEEAMKRHQEWFAGRPDEYWIYNFRALAAAFNGQRQRAHDLFIRAIEMADRRNFKELASIYASFLAGCDAAFGNCRQMREEVGRALEGTESEANSFAGLALVLCGDVARAQTVADDLAKRYPTNLFVQMSYLLPIRAGIEIERGNPSRAVELLRPCIPYEISGRMLPTYMRGQAYLRMNAGKEAAAEFQKILDNRGWEPLNPMYVLSHLGLGRAMAKSGDMEKSRRAYEAFFEMWKEADPDLPVLQDARREYDRLK